MCAECWKSNITSSTYYKNVSSKLNIKEKCTRPPQKLSLGDELLWSHYHFYITLCFCVYVEFCADKSMYHILRSGLL